MIKREPILNKNFKDVEELFGEKTWETALYIANTLKRKLSRDKFTGKVVFTVNCKNGGIGSTEAFIQNKILGS